MVTRHGRCWLLFSALLGLFFSLLISGTAAAAPLPKQVIGGSSATATSQVLPRLYQQLRKARNLERAQVTERRIASVWASAGDSAANTDMRNALAALAARDFEVARALLDRVISRKPAFTDAWVKRAAISVARNRLENALLDLRQALSLDPDHFEAVHILASVLRRIGEPEAALSAYRRLQWLYPARQGTHAAISDLTRQINGQPI